MNFDVNDLNLLAPELFLLGAICVILLADLFVAAERRGLTHFLAILAMIGEQRRHLSDTGVAATPEATWRVLLDGAPIDPRDTLVAAPGSRWTLETHGGGGFV